MSADDDRLIASAVANGMTVQEVADELAMSVEDVRAAVRRGAAVRTWND